MTTQTKFKPVSKLIAEARKKPLAPDKMSELLTKLRKGATGGLTFGKIVNVLDLLGWKIQDSSAWIPLFNKSEKYSKPYLSLKSASEAQKEHDKMVDSSLDRLPGVAVLGSVAIMNVGPIHLNAYGESSFDWEAYGRAETLVLTSPDGSKYEIIPGSYDFKRSPSVVQAQHDMERVLKAAGWLNQINQALGTEAHVAAKFRSKDNTGTCAWCWANVKLGNGYLALHGYRRPGTGETYGRCEGAGTQPVETSETEIKRKLLVLAKEMVHREKVIEQMMSGKLVQIGSGKESVGRGEPGFENAARKLKAQFDRELESLSSELQTYSQISNSWRERPLPTERESVRTPKFFMDGK